MNLFQDLRQSTLVLFREGVHASLSMLLRRNRLRDPAGRPDEAAFAFTALRPFYENGTMVDVGAHFGGSLASFARANWQVFAFEPDSSNREKLVSRFGRYPNIVIDDRAVSNTSTKGATLFRSDQSSGISSLKPFHSTHVPSDTVDIITLRQFLSPRLKPDADVAFLKIDTEGHDLFVLEGVPWESVAPRLILCEFEDAKTIPLGYNFHDLARYLQEKGYQVIVSEWYPIKQYGTLHDWRRFSLYPCDLMDSKGWGNLFAVKDPQVLTALKELCDLS